nr:hypothetical protein [uncultured Desulfobulbus sp.]
MKKTQRENYTLSEDFEDLTLFANESFDTQDVDLFEFTSEESSPLTRLKSIILSLDWEINDEILQELSDEVEVLGPMWKGDKVAEVYLQGLAKIGTYIQTKGAYAHPNSIKLLLTFFYNFEKIISSPDITGDQITQLLKGDVRKFKILQYQITQSDLADTTEDEELVILPTDDHTAPPILPEDATPTQLLKAAILGLDWEVTEESLLQFNSNLESCFKQLADEKAAIVLLQGLQALGDYIGEERAHSHPDAFTLLHSFNEALEKVTSDQDLDAEVTQGLLVGCINRLNNLKMVIASPESEQGIDEDMIAGVVDEISTPAHGESDNRDIGREIVQEFPAQPENTQPEPELDVDIIPEALSIGDEIDSLFGVESKPAMETADEQYPDEILPPEAIHPVDDELADDLIGAQLSSKRGLAPALSDSDEEAGFSDTDAGEPDSVDDDLAMQLDFLFADDEMESTDGDTGPIAALADVEFSMEGDSEEKSAQEAVLEEVTLDIEGKLDSFFLDVEEEVPPQEATTAQEAEANERSLFFDEQTGPIAALADSDEEAGFSEEQTVAALHASPLDEIEEKLDFFFGEESEELDEDTPDMAPVLSDAQAGGEETVSPASLASSGTVEESSDLSGALDAFFETAEPAAASVKGVSSDNLTEALEATLEEDSSAEAITDDFTAEVATLGALLPAAVRALDQAKLSEAEATLAKIQKSSPAAEYKALAELLHSVIALLSRLPAKSAKDTEKLVNYLYEQLMRKEVTSDVLPSAITRFNSWMLEASKFMPRVPSVVEDNQETEEVQYSAKELYFELAHLKQYINDEFAKVRHHLEHHH